MRFSQLKRRDVIALLGGAAVAGPLVARAQQGVRTRRVGILLMPLTVEDPYEQARLAAFLQGLEGSGWSVGRNLRIDTRWGAGDGDRIRRSALELVALAPDVILAVGTITVVAVQQASRSVPIVFTAVSDPVGGGLVESLAHPGGNITGFASMEFDTSAKWLELLKEIAPSVTHAAVLRDTGPSGIGLFAVLQSAARSFGMNVSSVGVQSPVDIERAITTLACSSNAGLFVTGNSTTVSHRALIVALAARHRLPAVYAFRLFTFSGGLSSGSDLREPPRLGEDQRLIALASLALASDVLPIGISMLTLSRPQPRPACGASRK